MRTFSSAVRLPKTAEIWKERTTPRLATWAGAVWVTSSPRWKILPRVTGRNRVSRLNMVVLPAPFGPIRPWIEPRFTFSDTPFTATNPRNSLATSRVSRMRSSGIGRSGGGGIV